MPKKKDKSSGEKTDQSRKSKKTESSSTLADKTQSEDRGTEFYLTQIRHLEQQLERYQHKCDELEVQRRDFDSRYDTLQREKKDVVEYLKRSVAQKEDELDELSERLQALQSATRQERESLQLQLSQAGRQLQDTTDQLSAENMKLAGKLADLEEFGEQKERLLSELASLEKQLADQKEEHSAAVLSLERNALLENDRLKKEMHSHVAAVAAELRDMTERRMPETTVRAIRENAAVRSRLSQLSEQIHVLLQENEALRGRERQLRLEVSVLEPLLDQLTAKSRSHQKVAEQLTEKCQQLQVELAKDRSSAQQERQQLQTERTTLLAELDALRRDHTAALEESRGNGAEADRRGAELQEERRKRGRLERTVQEAAFALKQALTDAPAEDESQEDAAVRWKQTVQKLLGVLDGAALLDTNTERPPEGQSCSSTAASRAGALQDPVPRSRVQLPRYRPGDLGLVPLPTLRDISAPTKTGRPTSRSKPSSQRTAGRPGPSAPARPAPRPSTKP